MSLSLYGDLHLANVHNQQLGQTNIIDTYVGEKNNDVDDRLFNLMKSIINLANINNKTSMIIDGSKPKADWIQSQEKSC